VPLLLSPFALKQVNPTVNKLSVREKDNNMVQLVSMTGFDFQAYLQLAVEEYAQDHVKAGNWDPAEALQKSEKEYRQLLSDGVASKDQYLFTIEDGQTGLKAGMIWFAVKNSGPRTYAFIYDFRIYDEYQRKGYGSHAMSAIETEVRELGIDTISLHVFGHNLAARALYEKMGYETTDLQMSKKIGS
jgi:ribosomal protein S18 acetylase RimI-like enzyme